MRRTRLTRRRLVPAGLVARHPCLPAMEELRQHRAVGDIGGGARTA